VTSSFPVEESDQIMLVTDAGKLIRTEVHDIRIARRQTQGVTIFKVAEDERVVAVAHLSGMAEEGDENGNGDESESGGEDNGGK
jgi:DNA gyrase subunit A